MIDIRDVRLALWRAYKRASESGPIYGKSSEGWCEVVYPVWWDHRDDVEGFLEPIGVNVYSYALGPSRMHEFRKGDQDARPDHRSWESPDPFAKAVEVINGWADKYLKGEDEAE